MRMLGIDEKQPRKTLAEHLQQRACGAAMALQTTLRPDIAQVASIRVFGLKQVVADAVATLNALMVLRLSS